VDAFASRFLPAFYEIFESSLTKNSNSLTAHLKRVPRIL